MSARNLGVVFGRKPVPFFFLPDNVGELLAVATLMRSSDPAREFADMAGKALSIEWLVEHAPSVFRDLGEN